MIASEYARLILYHPHITSIYQKQIHLFATLCLLCCLPLTKFESSLSDEIARSEVVHSVHEPKIMSAVEYDIFYIVKKLVNSRHSLRA